MWRSLVFVLGFLAVAWLEFEFVPGHSYLAGDSRLYVTILQHLAAPGYLSRDIVASHPNVTYTAFDEITLFLHRAFHLDLRHALLGQEFVCRCAGLLGLWLLARAAGLRPSLALAASAIVNLGAYLPGVAHTLIEREPVPPSMAIGLLFLAFGCLAREKPLLAGFFGGVALLYDPVLASLYWASILLAFVFDRRERRLLRPMLPVLLVFVLLLANLAQLQPGPPDPEPLFSIIPARLAGIEIFRLPSTWLLHWPRGTVSLYLGLFVIGMAAVTRLWPVLSRHSRWIFLAAPLLCLLTIPFSAVFVDRTHWLTALRIDFLRLLIFLVAFSWLAAVIAGLRAVTARRFAECSLWLAACLLFASLRFLGPAPRPSADPALIQLASWAKENTWGDSLFLFPDAARDSFPSTFRALSIRGLWVDWDSGAHINSNSALAYEWWQRWDRTGRDHLDERALEELLRLPIDYLVLNRTHKLESRSFGVRHAIIPAFRNTEFEAYDAETLRFAPGRLIIVPRT